MVTKNEILEVKKRRNVNHTKWDVFKYLTCGKRVLLIFILCLACFSSAIAQNVIKSSASLLLFSQVYGTSADVDDYPASKFPSPYVDIQKYTDETEKKLIVMTYLDYGDGVPVVRRHNAYFDGGYELTRAEAVGMLLEAYNITPLYSSEPYSDVNQSTAYSEYISKAYSLGIIPNSSKFNPWDRLKQSDFFDWLKNVKKTSYHPVSQSTLKDIKSYFIPNNFLPQNLSQYVGLEHGVFDHYAKNSFVIPDRKLNLNFSHYYSSKISELPSDLYPLKPLARGWTHTYNSYIYRVEAKDDDYYYIVWADGTIDIYNDDENEYESIGVYDDFDESSSTRIYITNKSEIRYTFRKLDTSRDIYYLTEIRDRNGNDIDIHYENAEEDDTKRIESVESPSGKELEFSYYDDYDYIEKITDPIGRKIYFEFSNMSGSWSLPFAKLVNFEDAKGNVTKYQYATNYERNAYLLREIELPRGNVINARYTRNGKVEEVQNNSDDPIEVEWHYNYANGSFEVETDITVPVDGGKTTEENYEFNTLGLLERYQDDNNDVRFSYPSTGVNIALPKTVDYNSVEAEYDYTDEGNINSIEIEGETVGIWSYYSSHPNRLQAYSDGESNLWVYYYDGSGNVDSIQDPMGSYIDLEHDQYGQMTSIRNQEGIQMNIEYESDGAVKKIIAPENYLVEQTHDGINRLLSRTVNGLSSRYDYDKNDNLTSITNNMSYVTIYDYDENDNLSKITSPKSTNANTYFEYDDKDRLIEFDFGSSTKEYVYGEEGYLEKYIKPDNSVIRYSYDNDGRITDVGNIDIAYDSRNRIDEVSNPNGTLEFDYDDFGRVDEVIDGHNNNAKITYKYLNNDLVASIVVDDGVDVFKQEYFYDKNNNLTEVQVRLNSGSSYQIAQYKYFKDNRLSEIEYFNGMKSKYEYDGIGRVTQILSYNRIKGDTLYIQKLSRDNRGNIAQDSSGFGYWPSGYNGGSSYPIYFSKTYDYSSTNRLTKTTQLRDETDRVREYNVGLNGNTLEEKGINYYSYDQFDNLTKRANADDTYTFTYNALGQRVGFYKDDDHVGVDTDSKLIRDVLSDNVLVEHYDVNGTKTKYFYVQGLGLTARIDDQGGFEFYHFDTRGSTVAITDDTAGIQRLYTYDVFGAVKKNYRKQGAPDNRYCYVGQYGVEYHDKRLIFMRARYYDATIGRFISEDPIWSTNLFPYADNDPVNRVDPKGRMSEGLYHDLVNGLGNKLYLNGYGDAAMILSSQSVAFDYALSNPEIAGLVVGVGVAGAAHAITYGAIQLTPIIMGGQSFTYQYAIAETLKSGALIYSGVTAPIRGVNFLNALGELQSGDSEFLGKAIKTGIPLIAMPFYRSLKL